MNENMNGEKNLISFNKKLPDAVSKHFSLLNSSNCSKMHAGFVNLLPGEEIGSHSTGSNEELIIFLEGNGLIDVNGSSQNIAEGYIAYNPPYTFHNVINNSTEILKYIYVVTES
jgi:mannose-6-phosphate isomerase-like protein (cupin superfamily)